MTTTTNRARNQTTVWLRLTPLAMAQEYQIVGQDGPIVLVQHAHSADAKPVRCDETTSRAILADERTDYWSA